MSAIAASPLKRVTRFYEATNGKKAIMALTGVILFAYVVGHLVGNLQVFAGDGGDRINHYAELLHSTGALLWVVRALLLLAVGLHIVASFQLWALNRAARPVSYYRKDDVPASYAARTMQWSGPIIAAFIVFHILHLTAGTVLPMATLSGGGMDVYSNIVNGFRIWYVSLAYMVAVSLLGLHLFHGIWSMFQSLGISHPRYTPGIKKFAAVFAIVLTAGYLSIPVAVMAGIVR